MFIVIEGPDGVGKTTLIQKLKEQFSHVKFITPFDTDIGKDIKRLLLHPQLFEIQPVTKAGLMTQCLRSTYTEYLQNSQEWYVVDRWIPTFYAYQKPWTDRLIFQLFSQYFDYLDGQIPRPDYSFYLTASTDTIVSRIQNRNHCDALDDFFLKNLESIVQAYDQFIGLQDFPTRYEMVVTEKSIEEVFEQVKNRIHSLVYS